MLVRMPSYFTKDGLAFLDELRTHNDKAWFEKNRARYEAGLKEPAMRLMSDLSPALAKISKRVSVDLRPNGGSLSRLNRDTRFSKDKSPYKTALFFHFYVEDGTEEAAPGFYMHLGPGESRIGGGVWRPAPASLAKIRDAIAEGKAWTAAKKKAQAGGGRIMEGDPLKKVPKGYHPAHAHAEDLKRRDFGVSVDVSDAALVGGKLVETIGEGFRTSAPMVKFVCEALGIAF
jgi:uncharacterized protein (TIGR02453 family)